MFARTVVFIIVVLLLAIGANLGSSPSGRVADASQADATPNPSTEIELDPMTAAALSMLQSADVMETGADLLTEEGIRLGESSLTELAAHWRTDAELLRDRGIWMLLSSTAGAMIHDPDDAHQLDLRSLRANGETMIVEGEAMSTHGEEMTDQVGELRDNALLASEVADSLIAAAEALIDSGTQIAADGREMRDYADRLLESLGE